MSETDNFTSEPDLIGYIRALRVASDYEKDHFMEEAIKLVRAQEENANTMQKQLNCCHVTIQRLEHTVAELAVRLFEV
jgi:hypothetical protein